MSRRRLSDDERALWKGVARSVTPLRKRSSADDDDSIPARAATASAAKSRAKVSHAAPPAPVAPKPSSPPAHAPLDRRARKRIASGRHAIDGRLDLHGLTQAEAHDVLFGFLRARQARGAKVVLVITGKGGGSGEGRGVLKRMVPLWLHLPEFRTLVLGCDSAAAAHGGEGALYVRLRRSREG